MSNFIANVLEIVKGTYDDYKSLREYHYVIGDPVCTRQIWKVRAKPPYVRNFPDPIAVIVYSVPIGEWTARNKALGNFFDQFPTKSKRQSAINFYVTYIARIIVDPRFHRQGIGSYLLTESLKYQTHALIETMTPIDKYLKMFTKNDFKLHFQPTPHHYTEMTNAFLRAGILRDYWHIPEIVQTRLEHLSRHNVELFNKASKKFVQRFHHHENMKSGIDRVKYILSKLIYPNAYYLRINPKYSGDEFTQDY